jgi:O-antigen ligase
LSLWETRPLGGFGYYAGHRVALSEVAGTLDRSNLDNVYIETLLGTGILGLTALGIFMLAGWVRIERSRRTLATEELAFMRAVVISVIAVSFVNPTLQTNVATMIVAGFVLLLLPRPSGVGRRAPSIQVETRLSGATSRA